MTISGFTFIDNESGIKEGYLLNQSRQNIFIFDDYGVHYSIMSFYSALGNMTLIELSLYLSGHSRAFLGPVQNGVHTVRYVEPMTEYDLQAIEVVRLYNQGVILMGQETESFICAILAGLKGRYN